MIPEILHSVLQYWLVLAKCVSESLIFFPLNGALGSNFSVYIVHKFVREILKCVAETLKTGEQKYCAL